MSKAVLTDTGFWLGLLDATDSYHAAAETIAEWIVKYPIILPWPCLYETISTRLTRRRDRLLVFEKLIASSNVNFIDDEAYKIQALNHVFRSNRYHGFSYSLTDSVLREILKDVNVSIKYFVTFNEADFKDICDQRRI